MNTTFFGTQVVQLFEKKISVIETRKTTGKKGGTLDYFLNRNPLQIAGLLIGG
jgi:hypothetical protein